MVRRKIAVSFLAFFALLAVASSVHASTISWSSSTQTISGAGLFGNSNGTDIYTWMSATGTNVAAGGTFSSGSGTWSKTLTDLGANGFAEGTYVLFIFNQTQWFGACGAGKTLDDCISGIGGQGVNDTQNYIAVPINVGGGGGTNTTTTVNTTSTVITPTGTSIDKFTSTFVLFASILLFGLAYAWWWHVELIPKQKDNG